MILDKENEFSDAVAVLGVDINSDVIDLGAAGDAYDKELYLVIQVDTAAAGGTSIDFILQTATDEAFTSPVQLWSSGAVVTATLVAGYQVAKVRVPSGCLQYLRVQYDVTGTMTGGTYSAFLTPNPQANDL